MKVVNLIQGTPEWHTWRMGGLGGSDSPVVMDASPYKTRRQLFYEKKGLLSEDGDSNEFIFSKGHKAEAVMRKEFLQLTGVEMKPLCAEHAKLNFVRASIDGFDSKLGVLEAKLVGQDVLSYAKTHGSPPLYHMIQIQHQMEVCDVDVAQWFGHDGKSGGILVPVKRDKKMTLQILNKDQAFWSDLKEGRIPELTAKDYLVPDDLTLLIQLREAKELAENAPLAYEMLRQKVADTFKHPRIAGAGIKMFQVTKQGSVKWNAIPEVAKAMDAAESIIAKAKAGLAPDYIEGFRGQGSQYWSVIMDKKGSK